MALLSGVGVARALEAVGLAAVAVKWPNDVYAGPRKIAGVLAEPRLQRGMIEFVVLGLGVNVGQSPGDFPRGPRRRRLPRSGWKGWCLTSMRWGARC